jgi:hypothetical protein
VDRRVAGVVRDPAAGRGLEGARGLCAGLGMAEAAAKVALTVVVVGHDGAGYRPLPDNGC